jgi:hypothetical protein
LPYNVFNRIGIMISPAIKWPSRPQPQELRQRTYHARLAEDVTGPSGFEVIFRYKKPFSLEAVCTVLCPLPLARDIHRMLVVLLRKTLADSTPTRRVDVEFAFTSVLHKCSGHNIARANSSSCAAQAPSTLYAGAALLSNHIFENLNANAVSSEQFGQNFISQSRNDRQSKFGKTQEFTRCKRGNKSQQKEEARYLAAEAAKIKARAIDQGDGQQISWIADCAAQTADTNATTSAYSKPAGDDHIAHFATEFSPGTGAGDADVDAGVGNGNVDLESSAPLLTDGLPVVESQSVKQSEMID